MNLSEVFVTAQKQVDDANLAEDLRAVAFAKAVDLLTSGAELPRPAGPTRSGEEDEDASDEDPLQMIASKLGKPREKVEEIFYVDEGEIGLSLPSSRLEADKAGGARQVALLVAVSRQATSIDADGWTKSSVLREACKHFGKFDQKHFGETIAEMDDVFQLKGKGQSREARVKAPGFERAAELIDQLTS